MTKLSSLTTAQATLNIDFSEISGGVMMTASGSSNFTPTSTGSGSDATYADNGNIVSAKSNSGSFSIFTFSSSGFVTGGPSTITTSTVSTDTVTGDVFGFLSFSNFLQVFLPSGYTAGDTISGTAFLDGETLADLNMPDSGSGVWDITGVGGNEDITWTIGAVPEPSAAALLAGFSTAGFCARRRR